MTRVLLPLVAYLVFKLMTKTVTPMDKKSAFVAAIWPDANKLASLSGWPRDLIITVAAHESNWGMSELTQKSNNLFGMKTFSAWEKANKPFVTMKTWEHIDGKNVYVDANFRSYPDYGGSIKDYISLISRLSRYNEAEKAAKAGDLNGYFKAVQKGGYATDPKYAAKLASVHRSIETITV